MQTRSDGLIVFFVMEENEDGLNRSSEAIFQTQNDADKLLVERGRQN